MITIRTIIDYVTQPETYGNYYNRAKLQEAIKDHVPLLSRKRVLELFTPLDEEVRVKLALIVLSEGDPEIIEDLMPLARRSPTTIYQRVEGGGMPTTRPSLLG